MNKENCSKILDRLFVEIYITEKMSEYKYRHRNHFVEFTYDILFINILYSTHYLVHDSILLSFNRNYALGSNACTTKSFALCRDVIYLLAYMVRISVMMFGTQSTDNGIVPIRKASVLFVHVDWIPLFSSYKVCYYHSVLSRNSLHIFEMDVLLRISLFVASVSTNYEQKLSKFSFSPKNHMVIKNCILATITTIHSSFTLSHAFLGLILMYFMILVVDNERETRHIWLLMHTKQDDAWQYILRIFAVLL